MPADKLPVEARVRVSKWKERAELKKKILDVKQKNEVLKGKIRYELHKGKGKSKLNLIKYIISSFILKFSEIEEGNLNEKIFNLHQKTFLIKEKNIQLEQSLEDHTKTCKNVEEILQKTQPDNIQVSKGITFGLQT